MNDLFLIGYSGHAFVVCDIFLSNGIKPYAYFDNEKKSVNPYHLKYLGSERNHEELSLLNNADYFVAIGDNKIRHKVITSIQNSISKMPINAIHKNASISTTAVLGKGIMIGDGAIINACTKIGNGVISNTQSVIEHECNIGAYSHIAPGAILCGNVQVGAHTFIGARAVIKQGINIGQHVTIGAGAVIIKDIPDYSKVVGNPQKII